MDESRPVKRTPRAKRPENPNQTQAENGAFLPSLPTSGNDLLSLWNLPREAWNGCRLKISRTKPGNFRQLELIGESTIEDYSMESIAREYGPGDYSLVLNPGPGGMWPAKVAKVPVAAEYARSAGYNPQGVTSAPRMADYRSIGETSQALQLGTSFTPAMVAQLVETAATRAAEAAVRAQAPAPQAQGFGGMEQMISMWSMFSKMQETSLANVLALAGINKGTLPEAALEAETSWPDLIREFAPVLKEVAVTVLTPRQAPQAPQAPQAQPRIINPEPQEKPLSVPLSQDELKFLAPAVGMLRPFVGMILAGMKANPDPATLAPQLADYIPEALAEPMLRLAEYAETRGPEVLNIISPELANPAGVALCSAIADVLAPPIPGDGNAEGES